jgi:peroxiredoxin Q/BCP
VVLWISPDPVAKLKRFAEKHALGFLLLSDQQHTAAEAYGVWVAKSMYGRTYFGNERTTFIIDPEGLIAYVLRKVKPAEHDGLVLESLKRARPPVARSSPTARADAWSRQ